MTTVPITPFGMADWYRYFGNPLNMRRKNPNDVINAIKPSLMGFMGSGSTTFELRALDFP